MPSLLAEYLAYLTDNRRLSPHSVRAYHATADRLTGFLQLHWGTDVTRETLRKVSAADMRAFLADRRGDGLTNRSTARELSATRHFLRFALGDDVTLPVMNGPRVQRSLTLRNRKASMTPPALPKVDPMMHRDPSRGTCAASRPVCPSPKGTR